MLYEAQVVLKMVNASPQTVYDFACQIENLPKWASGLANGIEQRDGKWITHSPMGEVEVNMAARNAFGVLDHEVKLPEGTLVYNALRVTPSGTGSVLTFTVLRMPGMTKEAFEVDAAHVHKDLEALRKVIESSHRSG